VNLVVDIQSASSEPCPDEEDIRRWIGTALQGRKDCAEVSVRLVDEEEIAALNARYRDRQGSTNVLSFPAELPPGVDHPLLGDIVLCPAVINREAAQQHKTPQQHWSHMLIHGSLHLLGYDHVEPREAEEMEALETELLARLGLPCPYGAVESEMTGDAELGA
jgi:probable rRNA maturation factor